jgi:hypothetical protein
MRHLTKNLTIAIVVVVASASGLDAQDPLRAAKSLYASAAYEDALTALSRLDILTEPDIVRQADEYRAFCLYALGRTHEAESVFESIVRNNPLAHLDSPDIPPRLEQTFTQVRRRLLLTLINDRVREARSEFDRKSFATAEPLLAEAQLLIHEATGIGVTDEALSGLNVVIEGFRQLIRSTADQRPALSSPPPAAALPRTINAPVPVPATRRLYSSGDKDVVPPMPLEETMPTLPRDLAMIAQAWKVTAVLRVVIDETGRVADAAIDRAFNSSVETFIVDTARQWKYRPATKDGVPVRYIKAFDLNP